MERDRKQLPIVVADGAARLEVAEALNANFPPVFSNAAVDLDNKARYWVTDGGAADNRGMEMLLYRHILGSIAGPIFAHFEKPLRTQYEDTPIGVDGDVVRVIN